MTPLISENGRTVGERHLVDTQSPVAIDQSGSIRDAVTSRTLSIALGSPTDRANLGATELLNPTYQPELHQVVADPRQHEEAAIKS